MSVYTMIYQHSAGHDIYHFKSEREDIDGITFGGVDFASDLMSAEMDGKDREEFEEDHEGWTFVQKLITHFDINFEPEKDEFIMIDMVPDEIELEIS